MEGSGGGKVKWNGGEGMGVERSGGEWNRIKVTPENAP